MNRRHEITPGTEVRIDSTWSQCYRKDGGPVNGVVKALSPTGAVARVQMDDVADSYILVEHLLPEPVEAALAA